MPEKKGKFWVRVPYAGVVCVQVEAESIGSKDEAFGLAMDAIDKSGFTLREEHNEGHENTCIVDEWEYHPCLVSGNVLHVSSNEVEWDSADD